MKQNKSSKPDNRLPNKLWELLQVALMDLTLVELSKNYVVDMYSFHESNRKCRVCLAGSVMAAQKNHNSYNQTGIKREWSKDYDALDDCRNYNFQRAIQAFQKNPIREFCFNRQGKMFRSTEVDYEINSTIIDSCSYFENPELFKANMETAAAILKKYNL